MKKLLLAGTFAVVATSVFAGSMSPPIIEPTIDYEVIETAAVASAGGDAWVGVLMTFLTIVVLGLGG